MKLLVKIFWSVVVVSVICTVIAICFVQNPLLWMHGGNNDQSGKLINIIIPNGKISLGSFATTGSISIHAPEPEVPRSVPIYKGVIKHGDNLTVMTGNLKELLKEKTDVTSEQDAPNVAVKALEQYGGLPPDAVLSISKTNYAEYYDRSTWEVVDRHPIMTTVAFNRIIQGMPVVGQCDGIMVDLGENDTVLSISKIWRSLEYTGKNTSVISPEKAIDKIRNGESIDPSFDMDRIQIYTITLGYYERSRTEPEITLEPVWVFSGNTTPKSPVKIIVYARQFANFTATPTTGKVPLAVTFTDTSDASPTKWNWDLGDGTNSTEQNPSHTYTTAGTYNVSLKAWNDLGSDTREKAGYITVIKPNNPIELIDQLIISVNNQNTVPRVFRLMWTGQLNEVKRLLNENNPSDAVLLMKYLKNQSATIRTSADAIIKEIDLPVNQAAIDQTTSLSADVKNLKLPASAERPLTLELEDTLLSLECAKDPAAVAHLNLFISSVKAQDGNEIPLDKVVQLITKAQMIIKTINP